MTPFGTRIAQGLLGTSIASGLTAQTGLLNRMALGFLGMTWKFTGAIKAGDTIRVAMTIKEARVSSKPGRGVLVRQIDVLNHRDELVQTGEWAVLVRTRMGASDG